MSFILSLRLMRSCSYAFRLDSFAVLFFLCAGRDALNAESCLYLSVKKLLNLVYLPDTMRRVCDFPRRGVGSIGGLGVE